MGWKLEYAKKMVSTKEAAAKIKSGDRICSTTGCSVPVDLLVELGKRKDELEDVEIYSELLFYPFEWLKGEYAGHIHYVSTFMGGIERKMHSEGNIDVISFQFSQTDWLMKNEIRPTVFVAEVSMPDEDGNMSLGPMGTIYGKCASQLADMVILQVNENTPYLYGEDYAKINIKDVNYVCESKRAVAELSQAEVSEDDEKIAAYIIPLIENGSTIQLGLGGVANAVGFSLEHHQHMGIHTEMLTDSMVHLINKGAIDNSCKTSNPWKTVISFALGSKKLYDYIDNNKTISPKPINYVSNPYIIGEHDNFISINSCLACDLTGQVGSEALGFKQFSGTGGQLDFVRGAGLSKGGKSFLCLKSVTKGKDGKLISKISASLPPGTAVTTPRTDVDYIVTEYGIARLKGKDFSSRAKALIEIAHPDFREELYNQACSNGIIAKSRA